MYQTRQSLLNHEYFREPDQACLYLCTHISCKAGFIVWLEIFVGLRLDTPYSFFNSSSVIEPKCRQASCTIFTSSPYLQNLYRQCLAAAYKSVCKTTINSHNLHLITHHIINTELCGSRDRGYSLWFCTSPKQRYERRKYQITPHRRVTSASRRLR